MSLNSQGVANDDDDATENICLKPNLSFSSNFARAPFTFLMILLASTWEMIGFETDISSSIMTLSVSGNGEGIITTSSEAEAVVIEVVVDGDVVDGDAVAIVGGGVGVFFVAEVDVGVDVDVDVEGGGILSEESS